MKILLDTHIWIWYLVGAKELPAKFIKLIDNKDHEIWLSPITLWETMVLASKQKISLQPDSEQWIREALKILPCHEAPLTHEIAVLSHKIGLEHKDPADRFLAATAIIYDLSFATLDKNLRKLQGLKII